MAGPLSCKEYSYKGCTFREGFFPSKEPRIHFGAALEEHILSFENSGLVNTLVGEQGPDTFVIMLKM